MKRIISALAVLAVLAGLCGARAEYNLESASLEELYALRDQLNARISALEQQGGQRVYDSGTYLIGRDIPAGDYVLVEHEDAVFASVIVREDASEESGLVAHHLVNGQAVIHLAENKWLTLSEAKAYPISSAEISKDGVTGEGGYLVGVQLPAGEYVARMLENAPLPSYSIYDGIIGTNAQLIKFEVLHEETAVTLSDGEYIELSGCRLAPKP